MRNYIEYAISELRNAHLKITKPRRMLVSLLAKSNKALSPYEMRDLLKKQKLNADVVTIYRVLEVLENISLVHKILAFGRYIRCNTENKNDQQPCHHYLICDNCHQVDEIQGDDLSDIERKITKERKFKISAHYLEFIGLCGSCQNKA